MLNNVEKVVLLFLLARMAHQDWKEKQINACILIATALIGVSLQMRAGMERGLDILLGVCVGAVVLLLSWVTGGSVGAGDGLLLMASGSFLGFWGNISLLMTALAMAGTVALFMIVVKKKGRDYRLPFAPFVLMAYLFQLV